jgi:hypothetical protein
VRSERTSTRSLVRVRVVAACAGAALVAILAVLPHVHGWASTRAAYHAGLADPLYDVPVDHDSLHRAGAILSREGGRYYVYVPRGHPVLLGNLRGAIRLWATPALEVSYPQDEPRWIFSYRTKRLVPPGLRVLHTYPVGPGISLVEVAP